MKKARVVLSQEAEEAYEQLKENAESSKVARSILNAIDNKKELIKANFQYGEPIAKNKIPAEYIAKYGITNLFWVGLPDFWRMVYTVTSEGDELVAFVLGITDHGKYDKKFGYR